MKNEELRFDRNCHVLYSRECEKEIRKKIALHYPEDVCEEIWTKVQLKYVEFLSEWRTDLGGKKNFHNGKGGTYDCIAIMTYYVVCKDVTSFREIEEIEENLVLPAFRKLKFVDCNKPFWKKLMYKAFCSAKSKCDKWHDYEMNVAPYEKDKPIYYEFTACPAAEFAKQFGLTEIMPALCNVDYASMELIGAKLIRKGTCVDGDKCDYTICGDKDEFCKSHPEYRDEKGYLKDHPKAAVVNLGCGLDDLGRKCDNGECKIYNLDFDSVIAVRNELLPAGEREENIACDLNDTSWFEKIDSSGGVVFFASGVFYYFLKEQVKTLVCKMAERFPNGRMVFDGANKTAVKMIAKTWLKTAKIKDVSAYFAVSKAEEELTPWSDKITVSSRGYMLGYNDLKDKSVSGFFRFLAKAGDNLMKMQIVRIDFKE